MNVRIFWVCAMKCMCAQTRPRFILSSERVLGGMEFEPMLTPREKSPLLENFPRGGSNPQRCGQRAQTLPTSYSGPLLGNFEQHSHWWRRHGDRVFFCVPSYISGVDHFWWHFCVMWPFSNPAIEVVTFRLRGWCMLGVFMLLAFTRLGHDCQDL